MVAREEEKATYLSYNSFVHHANRAGEACLPQRSRPSFILRFQRILDHALDRLSTKFKVLLVANFVRKTSLLESGEDPGVDWARTRVSECDGGGYSKRKNREEGIRRTRSTAFHPVEHLADAKVPQARREKRLKELAKALRDLIVDRAARKGEGGFGREATPWRADGVAPEPEW
jgi:hypothetical protein